MGSWGTIVGSRQLGTCHHRLELLGWRSIEALELLSMEQERSIAEEQERSTAELAAIGERLAVGSTEAEPGRAARSSCCVLVLGCEGRRCRRWGSWGTFGGRLRLGKQLVLRHKPRVSLTPP